MDEAFALNILSRLTSGALWRDTGLMGKKLLKTPLTAVLYAALFYFIFRLLPHSENYGTLLRDFSMPLSGYLLSIACGLWLSLVFVLLFGNTCKKGAVMSLLTLVATLGLQWVLPLFQQIIFGESTGVMAGSDTLLLLAAGSVSTTLLLILGLMLYGPDSLASVPGTPAPKPPPKYKLHTLGLLIRIAVLPFIFCALYFLLDYYMLWRVEAVRAFYGAAEDGGFMAELIDMLLTNFRLVPMALLKGLLCALLSLPLLFQLMEKRLMFLLINVMLHISGAMFFLIPNPILPDPVRFRHFIAHLVIYVPYGVFCAFLLHTAARKLSEPAKASDRPATAVEDSARKRAPAGTNPAARNHGQRT